MTFQQSYVSPFQALLAAHQADPNNKQGRTMPKQLKAPPGTGTFGRFIHDVGYVVDLFTDPCLTDPFALVVSSVPAILRAAWSIIEPDQKELFHLITGKSVVCTLKTQVNEQGTFENWGFDGGKQTLFRIAEVADLAVWKLFLASVLTDGLIEWQSMAQELSGCAGDLNIFSSHVTQGATGDNTRADEANGFQWLTGSPHFPAFGPTLTLLPGQHGYLLWMASGMTFDQTPVPLISWIEDNNTGNEVMHAESIQKSELDWHPTIMHFRTTNQLSVIQSWTAKCFCPFPTPGHAVFCKQGYCTTSG